MSSPGSVCEFHKNLEGDSICPPYRYKVQPRADSVIDVLVYRPPCLVRETKFIIKSFFFNEIKCNPLVHYSTNPLVH